ncbi:MAG: two-component system response regulator [Desulfobacterales bacterium]|nr:two-component system response regulator [Desulfobacterales bacterium]
MSETFNFTVLVVDDTEANIDVLVNTLEDLYDVKVAMDGETALADVLEEPPDLILLDIMMPGMDGYEVCQKLKENEATQNIPVIFLTAMTEEKDEAKGLALGAVDYVTKPFSPELVKARVKNQLELKRHRDHLEEIVQERTKELALTQEVTIYSLASLAETRDPETGGHILRTQRYIKALAEQLKNHPKFKKFLDERTIDLLYKSAPLHDIGKVGVADHILKKPGKLTNEEFDEMKKHTTYGRDALSVAELKLGSNSFMKYAKEIAYTHQEKWDGSGYPQGLKGETIPVSGRLMAIADVYDALVCKRVYKPPFSHQKAVEIIKEGKGKHFDPDMVDAFVAIEDNFRKIAIEFADSDEEKKNLSL